MASDPLHEQLIDECETLEALRALLTAPGSAESRIDEALEFLATRLRALARTVPEPCVFSMPAARMSHAGPGRLAARSSTVEIIGGSPAMREVEEGIRRVSQSHATVLIRGESGTGKELVARAIHLQSLRADGPFIPLHCAAVTETLLESELFGHERGAFTGAHEQRKGKFELADGGTLFLDEIGDIPPATQVKLLRVLQERCVERVGGAKPIGVDVRVISATHRDLEAMVQSGAFREDLYYRLNVVPITLPPLRARGRDIPLLIDYFLAKMNTQNRRRVRLGDDLLELMARYHWPGNVRELQNCVERLVVLVASDRDPVTFETIPTSLRGYFADMRHVTEMPREQWSGSASSATGSLGASLEQIERERLQAALERTGGVQAKAARMLGLTPRQVAYKMRKYGIGVDRDDRQ